MLPKGVEHFATNSIRTTKVQASRSLFNSISRTNKSNKNKLSSVHSTKKVHYFEVRVITESQNRDNVVKSDDYSTVVKARDLNYESVGETLRKLYEEREAQEENVGASDEEFSEDEEYNFMKVNFIYLG